MKAKAKWIKCTNGDEQFHEMGDGCVFCAPYWIDIPVCPIKHIVDSNERTYVVDYKLKQSGYCPKHKMYFDLSKETIKIA